MLLPRVREQLASGVVLELVVFEFGYPLKQTGMAMRPFVRECRVVVEPVIPSRESMFMLAIV